MVKDNLNHGLHEADHSQIRYHNNPLEASHPREMLIAIFANRLQMDGVTLETIVLVGTLACVTCGSKESVLLETISYPDTIRTITINSVVKVIQHPQEHQGQKEIEKEE